MPTEKEIRAEINRRKKLWSKLQQESKQAVAIGIQLAKQRNVDPRELRSHQKSGYVVCYRLTADELSDRLTGMATLRHGKLTMFHPDADPTYQGYPDLSNLVLDGFLEQAIRLILVSLGIEPDEVEIIVPKR